MTYLSRTKPEKQYQVGGHTVTCSQVIDKYEQLHGKTMSQASAWRRIHSGCTYDELFHKTWQGRTPIEKKPQMGSKIQLEKERNERTDFFKIFNLGFRS